MVLVAAYGGLRFGELTALTRADVTIPKDGLPTVTVRRAMHRINGTWITGTPKSDAGRRTVALPGFLAPILTDHLDTCVGVKDTDLVFATRSGEPLARSNWTATFGRARKQVHLENVHFHDLRHAAATLAVRTGAALKDTMARLGHSSPRAALIYQHAASDRDHAIARALDAAAQAAARAAQNAQPADTSPPEPKSQPRPPEAATAATPATRTFSPGPRRERTLLLLRHGAATLRRAAARGVYLDAVELVNGKSPCPEPGHLTMPGPTAGSTTVAAWPASS